MYKLNINSIFVSVFGVGYIPFASGTFGSLAGLIIGYLIYLINYNLLFLAITWQPDVSLSNLWTNFASL